MISHRLLKLFANIAAFRGRSKEERHAIRTSIMVRYGDGTVPEVPVLLAESLIYGRAQDILFPAEVENAERLMIILVPEHNDMSGGVYSMFSIANHMWRIKTLHGYEVVMMTRPNVDNITYLRQMNFRNSENVFRFEQLARCTKVREIYLHVPEYEAENFADDLTKEQRVFLRQLDALHINLLNQNTKLMPERSVFQGLFGLTNTVTQSVAHHSYFSQERTDRYGIPSLLLPAYTDLSEYTPSKFEDKEDLIIYSLDEAVHKDVVLQEISEKLPHYRLLEIRNIRFDKYMEYAARCRFSISFGEGFDGYVAQPIHMGGIGLTVYNEEFFPSPHFTSYANIFSSEEDMKENIVNTIQALDTDRDAYTKLNRKFEAEYHKLYSKEDYLQRIKKLAMKDFELFPPASEKSR